MPIVELYSNSRDAETATDVYRYNELPVPLREQLCYILRDALGPYCSPTSRGFRERHNSDAWVAMRTVLLREHGRPPDSYRFDDPERDLLDFVRTEKNVGQVLDVIVLACRFWQDTTSQFTSSQRKKRGIKQGGFDAIDEINHRLRQHGIGYQYEAGQIIRIDSSFAHVEIVKPALAFVGDKRFSSAQNEYLKGHDHYRQGDYREAVTAANAAFESTMKVIADLRGWEYERKARASDLVKVMRRNKLLPDYLERSFDQLAATLQSGLPEVRNEDSSAHGLGPEKRSTPPYVAAYALHLAASKILFLVAALRDLEAQH